MVAENQTMAELNILQLWCIGMVGVIAVALIFGRKRKPEREPWKAATYNPKEFRRPRE
jgi:hypothetical protein